MWIWVEHGPKYKEKDWTNSDFWGVQIYEEEWTGWMNTVEGEQTSVSMARVRKVECVDMGRAWSKI